MLDFDDVERNLFLLEQLAYASKDYCTFNQISCKAAEKASNEGNHKRYASLIGEWNRYAHHLELHVSNIIIECAIKTRLAQDFVQRHDGFVDTVELDKQISSDVELGKFSDGEPLFGIRKSCNKIVHATQTTVDWHEDTGEECQYWSGILLLSGEHYGSEWNLELFVKNWTLVMRYFHKRLAEDVDWWKIYDL